MVEIKTSAEVEAMRGAGGRTLDLDERMF